MVEVALLAVFGTLLLVLLTRNWRIGLLLAIVVGFLQDPLRKMAPGEPVHFVLLALVAVGLCGMIPFIRKGGIRLMPLFHRNRILIQLLVLFLAVVFIQAVHSFTRFGAPILTGLGIMFYTAPLLALWLGAQYARTTRDVDRWLRLYALLALIAAFTVVLSYLGVQTDLFREIGPGVRIYERTLGVYIQAYPGLLRSSEIAAWHIGTGACFLIIIGLASGKTRWMVLAIIVALGLLVVTTLTGRRKVLGLVAGFAVIYGWILWNNSPRSVRDNLLAGMFGTGLVVITFLVFSADQQPGEGMADYLSRAATVWGDMGERLDKLGFGAMVWAWNRGGIFGLGTGVTAQGAQHFGGGFAGGAGEGGLGKILVELGVPGLLLFVLLLAAIAYHYWRILRFLRYQSPRIARTVYGLIAWLAANVPVFVVAAQVYGDPFVLLLLGLAGGFVLAAPQMVQRVQQQQRLMQCGDSHMVDFDRPVAG